jgi:hypothetical protein
MLFGIRMSEEGIDERDGDPKIKAVAEKLTKEEAVERSKRRHQL